MFVILATSIGISTVEAIIAESSVIQQRQQLMKELAGHSKAIGRSINAPIKSAEAIAKRARAMSVLALRMPFLFKPGTGLNAVTKQRTGARPEIWQNWNRFVAASRRLADESRAFARRVTAEGKQDLRLPFAALTMGGCGDCHRAFRKNLD